MRILVVEDEKRLADTLCELLAYHRYTADAAYDGETGLDNALSGIYDAVILDVMMPKKNGYQVVQELRKAGVSTPVLMLTAKSETSDKVEGLDHGADYYLTKPFEILELLARVETVLRRYGKEARLLRFEDVEADTLSRTVRKAGIPVKLTVKEYELLLLFLRNPGIALFRDRIYQLVWGGEYSGDSRTVDLHVQRLRKKLQWEGKLFAVYKIGYRLEGGREREPR